MIAELKERLRWWAIKKLLGNRSLVYNAYIKDGLVVASTYVGCWIEGPLPESYWNNPEWWDVKIDTPFVPTLPLL